MSKSRSTLSTVLACCTVVKFVFVVGLFDVIGRSTHAKKSEPTAVSDVNSVVNCKTVRSMDLAPRPCGARRRFEGVGSRTLRTPRDSAARVRTTYDPQMTGVDSFRHAGDARAKSHAHPRRR